MIHSSQDQQSKDRKDSTTTIVRAHRMVPKIQLFVANETPP
jgi:hypothetical protein